VIAVYLAHCYGGHAAHRDLAGEWVSWLAHHGFAPVADWIVLSSVWTEDMRDRGLAIDCELIRRCDVVLQAGPTVSAGMLVEEQAARDAGVPVVRGPVVAHPGRMARAEGVALLDDLHRVGLASVYRRAVGARAACGACVACGATGA